MRASQSHLNLRFIFGVDSLTDSKPVGRLVLELPEQGRRRFKYDLAGLLVGMFYGLIDLRSPAPPLGL
jgi:hypothetical protein